MRFHLDFRVSNSGRLAIAFLFSLVLHALLLFYIRFAQPSWTTTNNETTTLNVILQKTAAEVAQPAGIPQASLHSKGAAKIGVQAATPVPAAVPVPQETRPTVTLSQNEPRKPEPPKVPSEEKILAMEKPAKFTVPESTPELPETKILPPEITEEKAKPPAPIPSVENLAAKTIPPVEEPRKIVAAAPAPKTAVAEPPRPVEQPKPEEPKPVKVEEPKPVKIEEPKPIKVEEPKPVKVEEPKPVKIEEPKPVKVEQPKPVKIEEPKPIKVEEPKPAKAEEPKPVKIEEPKPVKPEVAAGPKTSPFGKPDETRAGPPGYSARSMSEFGIEAARGLPKITDKRMAFAERRKIVGSKEQELRYVMYRDSVILKLQRVGQFNYPAEAARNNQGGSLIVQFSIRPDGSLEEISIVQPSPHEALNAGAEKIIKMCAPFSPLPESIRRDTDILTIRINWNFVNSRQALD